MAEAKTRDRTLRGLIQAEAGDAGAVLPRIEPPDREHRYVGWWWHLLVEPKPGCGCEHCEAARDGRDSFLGYSSRHAIVELAHYLEAHP